MELKQLKYFVTIAEEGTISAAARKLHITQPPLSTSIAALEDELGCILFLRGSRQITLTPQGRVIYQHALEILEMEKELMKSAEEPVLPIRMGLISSFDQTSFYEEMKAYIAAYPQTSFRIIEGNTFELLELLEKGKLDLAVIRTPYQQKSLKKVDLSMDHLIAAGMTLTSGIVTLEELGRGPLIIYRRWESIIREAFSMKNIDPCFLCINDDARTSLQWASHGLGTALVPDSCIHLFPTIPHASIPEIHTESYLRLVHRKDQPLHAEAERFFAYICNATEKEI